MLMERVRHYIGTAGFVLACIALVLAISFNHSQNVKTQELLHKTLQSSCDRQHEASRQWHGVIDELKKQQRSAHPDIPLTTVFLEFERHTYAVVDKFPACKLVK